jgi:hypothetical protein
LGTVPIGRNDHTGATMAGCGDYVDGDLPSEGLFHQHPQLGLQPGRARVDGIDGAGE